RFGLLDDARVESAAAVELARFGFAERIDPARRVGELGIGLQQAVEIIRALSQNAKILILDEPSAALTGTETEDLLRWLRRLRSEGTTCIYVSHRLPELFALCDRITVLRDGRHVATVDASKSNPDEIVSLMVGRSLHITARKIPDARATETPSLELEGFGVYRPRLRGEQSMAYAVQGVSLALGPGEIVGLCGAVGSGRTALLSAIFGCAKAGTVGKVMVAGRAVDITCPRDAIALGLASVPEDRKGGGLVAQMTLAENLALPQLASRKLMGRAAVFGLVDPSGEAILAQRSMTSLQIRGAATAPVSTLSGGNQQKVVLGKWLDEPPRVLLLDEPTRGVDVGAREEIYGILERLAEQGIAVLFASSDLTEVLRMAHRVIVLRQGRVSGVLRGDALTEATIVSLSTGASA
ncbi:MAG TPA: sugar ABC transporter ATP-binding protein, partial [Polyangiaceae bacterium]|nr:sugar ABC transporter ATP-binding protein [Polyangiaceae bacterium]